MSMLRAFVLSCICPISATVFTIHQNSSDILVSEIFKITIQADSCTMCFQTSSGCLVLLDAI